MSVINKMLKDLEQRQTPEQTATAGTTKDSELVTQASSEIQQGKSRANVLVILLLLGILVFLGVISWQLLTNFNVGSKAVEPSAELAQVRKNQEPEPSALVKQVTGSPNMVEVQSEQTQLESTAVEETVSASLVQTSNGISQSNVIPVALNEPTETGKQSIKKDLTTTKVEKTDTGSVVNKQVSLQVQNKALVAEIAAGSVTQIEPVERVESNTGTVKTQGSFSIEKSNLKLTPEQRVAKLMADANEAFDKGYITEAIEKFNKVLSVQDGHVQARNLLAVAWYGRGEVQKAIGILNDGIQRYNKVEAWRLTAAKVFFKENNAQGAFSYLDINLPKASKEFLTMKGSLARQLKKFPQAELVYSQLSLLEPNVGNWWLGLAISQDSQGKYDSAKMSYQKVVDLGGVSTQTIQFAKQRITELKG